MSTVSGGTNQPQVDIFAPAPPAAMGQEGSLETFMAQNSSGEITGNAIFQDTQANAEGGTTTTISVYSLPPGDSVTQLLLNSAEPNQPEVLPDPSLGFTLQDQITYTSQQVQANAEKMGITPDEMAADVALYGPALTNFAISQGVDPAALAQKVNSASDALGLSPPFSSMPQETQNAIMMEVVINEGSENLPASAAGLTPTKSYQTDLVSQIRAEMDLQESMGTGGASPNGGAAPFNSKDAMALYGQQFVSTANENGINPAQFALNANQSIADAQPPIGALTPQQQSQLVNELLLKETAGEVSPTGILASLTPAQQASLINGIKTAAAGEGTPQSGSTTSTSTTKTSTTTGVNAWFASTPLMAFTFAYLNAVVAMMKMQLTQGMLEIKMILQTWSLAQEGQKYEQQLGKLNQTAAIMGVIASASAIGIAGAGCMSTRAAQKEKEEVPTEPQYVPNKGDPTSKDYATRMQKNKEAANDANEQLKPMQEDVKTAQRSKEAADKKLQVENDNVSLAKREQQTKKSNKIAKEKELKDKENELSKTPPSDPAHAAKKKEVDDAKTAKDDADTEYGNAVGATKNAEKSRDAAKTEQLQANKEVHEKEKALVDQKAANDLHSNFTGYHLETKEEFHDRQKAVKDKNIEADATISKNQMFSGQMAGQYANLVNQSIAAVQAMQVANIKGLQSLLQGLQSITQQALQSMTQAFSASGDSVTQFLAALKELYQAVARAMAEMLKQ